MKGLVDEVSVFGKGELTKIIYVPKPKEKHKEESQHDERRS